MPPEVEFLVRTVGPVATLLVIAIYGFVKGWWVPGFIYDDVRNQLDRLMVANETALARLRGGAP